MKSEIPNCYYRTSIKALVLNDQKRFLLVREASRGWEMPGGGLDFGESPYEGIRRELQEEMGLLTTFIAEQPAYYFTWKEDVWRANAMYETQLGHLDFTPSDECVEVGFFTKEEAQEVDLLPNIIEFLKVFKPENH